MEQKRDKRRDINVARNTEVDLGDHFESFVDDQVGSGRYESASDVIRAGLHLLEDHEARLVTLRASLIEGEMSGTPKPIDVDAFLAEKRTEWHRRRTLRQ